MLEVISKQNNVIYIQPKVQSLLEEIENVFNYSDCQEALDFNDDEDEYFDLDPLDVLSETIIDNNMDANIDDLNTAMKMFMDNMENRCEVIDYIPLAEEGRITKISIGTKIGNSIINHCPVQCTFLEQSFLEIEQ